MKPDEARAAVLAAIGEVAPDCDPAALDPARPVRDQIELDSMDQLNVMIALGETTGVDIPERDYPHVQTVDALTAYLVAHPPG